jgi:hypothetical protein
MNLHDDHITHDEDWLKTDSEEVDDSDGDYSASSGEEGARLDSTLRARSYLADVAAGRYRPKRMVESLCHIAARAAVAHGTSEDPCWFVKMDKDALPEEVNQHIRIAMLHQNWLYVFKGV